MQRIIAQMIADSQLGGGWDGAEIMANSNITVDFSCELVRDVTAETSLCPFCGNDENDRRSLMAWQIGSQIHYVKCEGCAACGPISVEYPDELSAIEHWNRRHQ